MNIFKRTVKWLHDFLFDEVTLTEYVASVVKRFDREEYEGMSGQQKFEAVLKSVQTDAVGKVKDGIKKMTTDEQRLLVQKAVVKVRSMRQD